MLTILLGYVRRTIILSKKNKRKILKYFAKNQGVREREYRMIKESRRRKAIATTFFLKKKLRTLVY